MPKTVTVPAVELRIMLNFAGDTGWDRMDKQEKEAWLELRRVLSTQS